MRAPRQEKLGLVHDCTYRTDRLHNRGSSLTSTIGYAAQRQFRDLIGKEGCRRAKKLLSVFGQPGFEGLCVESGLNFRDTVEPDFSHTIPFPLPWRRRCDQVESRST